MNARPLIRRIVVAAAAVALALSLLPQPASAYDWTSYRTDFAGEELMRLTNLDRVALGVPALRSDELLVDLARDHAFTCPSTGATVYGRAKSMATTGYFGHEIYGCKKPDGTYYNVLDVLYSQFGYNTYRSENIAYNNYGVGSTLYVAGCDINGQNCKGPNTYSQQTVAVAERGFMSSSGHRADLLGNYDRFGCASWLNGSTSIKYFVCLFSLGGPKPLDTAAPTFSTASGSGLTVSRGTSITFSASFGDNFRLADGYVKVDSTVVANWAYSYDVTSTTKSVTVSTSNLSTGAHTLTWAARDVSTLRSYRSLTFYVK